MSAAPVAGQREAESCRDREQQGPDAEQAHHLAGPLGTAVTGRMFDLDWITRGTVPRSVRLTERGEEGLRGLFDADSAADRDADADSVRPLSP